MSNVIFMENINFFYFCVFLIKTESTVKLKEFLNEKLFNRAKYSCKILSDHKKRSKNRFDRNGEILVLSRILTISCHLFDWKTKILVAVKWSKKYARISNSIEIKIINQLKMNTNYTD
jgi:hypothetical protein